MHEVSLMQSAVETAEGHARKAGAERILRMVLRVGDFSGVVPDALEFAFPMVTQGTMAEGAALEIQRVSILCRCEGCGEDFQPKDVPFLCPQCGTFSADVRQGQEMVLASLEIV